MQLIIELDIEKIVREEIRNYLKENLVIKNVSIDNTHIEENYTVTCDKPVQEEQNKPIIDNSSLKVDWEYAPKPGRRRDELKIALHNKELELGRRLTPEEKGEVEATIEMEQERINRTKQQTKQVANFTDAIDAGKAEAEAEKESSTKKLFFNGEEVKSDNLKTQEQTEAMNKRTEEEQKEIPEIKDISTKSIFRR